MLATRNQICDALLAVLQGLPSTGNNVFLWDGHNVAAQAVPCVLIKLGSERNIYETTDQPRYQKRLLSLEIKCVGRASSGLAALLNKISTEVEAVLDQSLYLGGLLFALDLDSSGWTVDGDGDQSHGEWSLLYQATYFKQESSNIVPAVVGALSQVLAAQAPNGVAPAPTVYKPL